MEKQKAEKQKSKEAGKQKSKKHGKTTTIAIRFLAKTCHQKWFYAIDLCSYICHPKWCYAIQSIVSQFKRDFLRIEVVFGFDKKGASNIDANLQREMKAESLKKYQAPHSAAP